MILVIWSGVCISTSSSDTSYHGFSSFFPCAPPRVLFFLFPRCALLLLTFVLLRVIIVVIGDWLELVVDEDWGFSSIFPSFVVSTDEESWFSCSEPMGETLSWYKVFKGWSDEDESGLEREVSDFEALETGLAIIPVIQRWKTELYMIYYIIKSRLLKMNPNRWEEGWLCQHFFQMAISLWKGVWGLKFLDFS